MDFPKLELPSRDYTLQNCIVDQNKKTTFAGKLFSVIDSYQENHRAPLKYRELDSAQQLKEKACSTVNQFYTEMRSSIDEEMQAYILEHDGKIDSWGESAGNTVFKYNNVGDARFIFDYFGEDYTVTRCGKVERKSSKPVYRNHYRFPDTPEYKALVKQRELLESDVQKAKKQYSGLTRLLSFIGFLYLLIGILSVVGDMLFGLGRIIDPLFDANMSVGLIAALPYALYSIILGIFDGLSDPMSIFCIVLLLGACLIGMLACFACFRSCNTAAKALKQAKKELNRLVKSADYIKTAAENRELRKKNEDLAEQWHRAWYQWVCSTKKAAADAQEDWPEEVRANIEMMRKSFNQDAFKKQVDNADFNELLRQEKQKTQNQ